MEFKTSIKGIPFIEFDADTRMVFVKLSPGDKGFKWITVSYYQKSYIGKARREITERADFVVDVSLNMPKGIDSESLTKKKISFIRKLLKIHTNGNGFLPETAIPSIAEAIDNYKERKTRSDKGKPKKRTRRKKQVTLIKADENGDIQVIKADKNGNVKPKKKSKSKRIKKEKPKKVENKLGKTCRSCKNELFLVSSCNSMMLVGHGKRWVPVVHKGKSNCESCGVMPGGRHHLYCPVEECSRCGKKMMKCGCFK